MDTPTNPTSVWTSATTVSLLPAGLFLTALIAAFALIFWLYSRNWNSPTLFFLALTLPIAGLITTAAALEPHMFDRADPNQVPRAKLAKTFDLPLNDLPEHLTENPTTLPNNQLLTRTPDNTTGWLWTIHDQSETTNT